MNVIVAAPLQLLECDFAINVGEFQGRNLRRVRRPVDCYAGVNCADKEVPKLPCVPHFQSLEEALRTLGFLGAFWLSMKMY